MASAVVADTGFVIALLSARDRNHAWAVEQASSFPPPWVTCEAVVSEASHLLGRQSARTLGALLRRGALVSTYRLIDDVDAIVRLLEKYGDVPMSFADACLVRMTEVLNNPVLLSTDSDFRVYRRHGRQTIPCILPD